MSGLVVTNLHVFTRATNAIVKNVASGKVYTAIEVVGLNAKHDLCVIKINDNSIPPLSLATTERAKIGDEVYVASNPKGLEGSVTKGIVSSVRGNVGLLQIDAAISSGSSGGAVINGRAEVVGIVKSSLIDGQNLNFAIPVEYLKLLRLNLTLPIVAAGACAYRGRDKDKLKGLVQSVIEKKETNQFADSRKRQGKRVILPVSTRVYDMDGNLVELYLYSQVDGVLVVKQVKTYDENRLVTQLATTSRDGKTEKTTFDFDESIENNLWTKKFSGAERHDEEIGTQYYDSEGNMTEWLIKGQRSFYTYERNGRTKEQFVYSGANIGDKVIIKYRFSYEDDDKGNWIVMRESVFYPDKPEYGWSEGDVTYREITYFR